MLRCDTVAMSDSNNQGRPYRALVVDDDERLLALARLSLSKEGLDVETAETALEGLSILENAWSDIVILDVVLPDLSGW